MSGPGSRDDGRPLVQGHPRRDGDPPGAAAAPARLAARCRGRYRDSQEEGSPRNLAGDTSPDAQLRARDECCPGAAGRARPPWDIRIRAPALGPGRAEVHCPMTTDRRGAPLWEGLALLPVASQSGAAYLLGGQDLKPTSGSGPAGFRKAQRPASEHISNERIIAQKQEVFAQERSSRTSCLDMF